MSEHFQCGVGWRSMRHSTQCGAAAAADPPPPTVSHATPPVCPSSRTAIQSACSLRSTAQRTSDGGSIGGGALPGQHQCQLIGSDDFVLAVVHHRLPLQALDPRGVHAEAAAGRQVSAAQQLCTGSSGGARWGMSRGLLEQGKGVATHARSAPPSSSQQGKGVDGGGRACRRSVAQHRSLAPSCSTTKTYTATAQQQPTALHSLQHSPKPLTFQPVAAPGQRILLRPVPAQALLVGWLGGMVYQSWLGCTFGRDQSAGQQAAGQQGSRQQAAGQARTSCLRCARSPPNRSLATCMQRGAVSGVPGADSTCSKTQRAPQRHRCRPLPPLSYLASPSPQRACGGIRSGFVRLKTPEFVAAQLQVRTHHVAMVLWTEALHGLSGLA